ncbi:MAG: DUF4956 domain-containing protein [Muribaculaceae bacterium]|nr:DUF4956 domain-containing protein [Muribaculaceae bacterium]MBQ7853510.1 DUF4956 domain-containing protein [Muribaculaceae bacterium]
MEELESIVASAGASIGGIDQDFITLLCRCFFNMAIVWFIIHFLYYRKSQRRDYYFTFMLISLSIFFLIFLLGGEKIKVGFALGLFAIFGIIRYRTESMQVREMTYLFVIIAISVINALAGSSYLVLATSNIIFILTIWICEGNTWLKHTSCKTVQYDKINLITPDKREELMEDLKKRLGLNIVKVEVGAVDFLRDMAVLKVYYKPQTEEINTVDNIIKLNREQWAQKDS